MKELNTNQTQMISGAAEGVLKVDSDNCMIVRGYNYIASNGDIEFATYSIETHNGTVTFGMQPLPLETGKVITYLKCTNPDFLGKL